MSDKVAEMIEEKVQLLNKKVQDRKTQEIFEDEKLSYDDIADILEISEVQEPSISSEELIPENTIYYEGVEVSAQVVKPKPITISVLATMKSIAHTVQSKTRWDTFVAERKKKGEEVYTLSSKGDFTRIREITERMSHPSPPRHIVLCTHLTRFEDIITLIKYLDDCSTSWIRQRKIRLYLDEFDKYIDRMREFIETYVTSPSVIKITIVTATPRKIWAKYPGWEKIFILNPRIEESTDSYLMFKDCKHYNTNDIVVDIPKREWMEITEPGKKENTALIDHHHKVALKHPDIYTAGRVIFAPGNVSRRSHELVRQFWNTGFKCAVAIINGERTNKGFYGTLYLETGEAVDIPHMRNKDFQSEDMKSYTLEQPGGALDERLAQLNEILSDLYFTHNLSKVPFVITGRLCVERAQTLVHPKWGTFTDAIYFKATSPDDGYQQQRQLGHIKKWPSYRGIPRVFSPEQFRKDVQLLETRADKFATEYSNRYAKIQDYISAGGGTMTSQERKEKTASDRAFTRSRIVVVPTPFKTILEVNKFLKDNLKIVRGIQPFMKYEGYEISHRLNCMYKKKASELVADDRLTLEKYARLKKSLNITSTTKGQRYMVYPVYPTMLSPPGDVEYYVCYLPVESEPQ